MVRFILVAVVLLFTTEMALAVNAPKLPVNARKLTGAEIVALYGVGSFRFHNFTGKQSVTGTFRVNFTKKTASGTFVDGKGKGTWSGTVRISGDRFCRKISKRREGCVSVYVDGTTIYEVNGSGVVESRNSR